MTVKNENKLGWILAGLLLAIFVSAMDQTIVSTAMGTIVADLGGLDKFVWATSAYLVAEMAGMPIFGKLSDMYGRKRFFVFGILLFLIGSILCGTAHNIIELSVFRAIQGIGGGAMMPIAFAIVFDVVPMEKRGSMGGMFGGTFGLASIIGPLLGSYITDHWNWHWVFYINIPIGIIAIGLIVWFYHESHEHSKQKIDWLGALTLVASVVSLMFALELGGKTYAWDSIQIIGLFTVFVVFFALFLYVETKAVEPIISFKMFKKRLFTVTNLLSMFYGAAFIVPIVFIPIFVQGVFGGSATNSGLILLPLLLGSTVSSFTGGMLASKMSYRAVMIISGILLIPGIFLLGLMTADTSRFVVTLIMILTGLGVGFSFSVVSIAAIHSFTPKEYGSVNATISFIRELGMTVGITIYGVIQSHLMTGKIGTIFNGIGAHFPKSEWSDPRQMLTPETREHIPSVILHKLTVVLSTSIAHTFMWGLVPACLAFITVFFLGKERMKLVSKPTKKPSAS
ncbi:MDR family MFS transporter [Camelliibacillus cellulosilyticus]|uniref:MDR family MFS transporter n=1 Tax=Camelliibacillus cellulosilyticus TaxID=2174486 RepID=A0ABV9GMA0_9BACL